MREIRTSGSVRGEGGNSLAYSTYGVGTSTPQVQEPARQTKPICRADESQVPCEAGVTSDPSPNESGRKKPITPGEGYGRLLHPEESAGQVRMVCR